MLALLTQCEQFLCGFEGAYRPYLPTSSLSQSGKSFNDVVYNVKVQGIKVFIDPISKFSLNEMRGSSNYGRRRKISKSVYLMEKFEFMLFDFIPLPT